MDRVNVIANQVGAPPAFVANPCASAKSPDDVVICCAVRTPLAKAKRGGFAKTCPEEMLSVLLKAIQERTKLDPKLVGDVQIGNVLMPGSGAFTARQAVLMAENVAEKYGIPREVQDTLAAASHEKAVKAQKAGLFDSEIVPVMGRTAKGEKLVTKDEGMKEGTTVASLSKLNPAFKQGGTTTAGNSSQVTDGAACVLLARRSVAEKHGLPIL